MKEYIERDKVLAMQYYDGWGSVKYGVVTTADIESIPAADVVEVKRGRWIEVERENIWGDSVKVLECTNCKKSSVGQKGIVVRSNFCPNCGADMMEVDHAVP